MKLEAAPTFRDMGGAIASEDRRLRSGLLYRGGHLLDPSVEELAYVRSLGLRQVFDLRSASERARQPSRWLDACTDTGDVPHEIHSDVNTDVRAGHDALLRLLEADCGVSGARQMMLQTYRNFPGGFSEQLRPLFDALLDVRRMPVLVHCTAGKDRTGFACAMVMHALGADEETIFAEYLRTGDVLVNSPLAASLGEMLSHHLRRAMDPATIAVIMGVEEDFLGAAFDALHSNYGSIDAYLEQVAGMNAARCEQLRARLLEAVAAPD